MKYVVGTSPIVIKSGIAMPGDTVDSSDLMEYAIVKPLIASGHLTPVPAAKPAAKKVER